MCSPLLFLNSRPSFSLIIVPCLYVDPYIILIIACSVCTMLLMWVPSRLALWSWITSQCALPWRRLIVLLQLLCRQAVMMVRLHRCSCWHHQETHSFSKPPGPLALSILCLEMFPEPQVLESSVDISTGTGLRTSVLWLLWFSAVTTAAKRNPLMWDEDYTYLRRWGRGAGKDRCLDCCGGLCWFGQVEVVGSPQVVSMTSLAFQN